MQYEVRLLNPLPQDTVDAKSLQGKKWTDSCELLEAGRYFFWKNSLLFADSVSFYGFCSCHLPEQVHSAGLKFGLFLYGHFLWKTATHEMLHQKKMGGIGLKGGWEPKHAE